MPITVSVWRRWLTHDPAYPDEQPTAPLARYTYTASGELLAVYDRSGTQVRGFTYDAEHAGRMVAHHYAGRRRAATGMMTGRVTSRSTGGGWTTALSTDRTV